MHVRVEHDAGGDPPAWVLLAAAEAQGARLAAYALAARVAPEGPALDLDAAAEARVLASARSLTLVAGSRELADVRADDLGNAVTVVAGERPPSGEFAVIVASDPFERSEWLDGLLAPDGVLVVPSADDDVVAALGRRFPHVRLLETRLAVVTVVGEPGPIEVVPIAERDAAAVRAGDGTDELPAARGPSSRIALASRSSLPAVAAFGVHADERVLAEAHTAAEHARRTVDALTEELAALRARARQLDGTRERLVEAEQALAKVPELEEALDRFRDLARGETIVDLVDRLDRAQRVIDDLQSSASWRVTRPLRALKGVLRR